MGSARCCWAPAWRIATCQPGRSGSCSGATVAGTALMSVLVARYADRVGRRRWYGGLYVLLGVVGVVFAFAGSVWVLALAALSGVLSTEVIESGPFTSLEQPMLASRPRDRAPVHGFGMYNAVAAVGRFARRAGGGRPRPGRHRRAGALVPRVRCRWPSLGWVIARSLSGAVEPVAAPASPGRRLQRSRPTVFRLASLFAARLVRRRVHGVGVHRLLAAGPLRRLPGRDRRHVLRHRAAADRVVPGRPPPRRPVRAAAHDGRSPTCRPTCCSPPWPSPPTWPRRSRCCWPAPRCRRWTSRPARPTSWPWSTPTNAPPPPRTPTPPATSPAPSARRWRRSPRRSRSGCRSSSPVAIKSVYDLTLWRWFRNVPLPEPVTEPA